MKVWIAFGLAPASMRSEAKVWRHSCADPEARHGGGRRRRPSPKAVGHRSAELRAMPRPPRRMRGLHRLPGWEVYALRGVVRDAARVPTNVCSYIVAG